MKLCFLADARNPIARNWISYFVSGGHEVRIISSYPCRSSTLPVASQHVVPIAFSGLSRIRRDGSVESVGKIPLLAPLLAELRSGQLVHLRNVVRHCLGPLDMYRHAGRIKSIVRDIAPDLLHAMRIPFEGILAALAVKDVPLLVSVWGNDFTLHARSNPMMKYLTQQVLHRADALHTDCQRDVRLARAYGFPAARPAIVLPGAGGVQTDLFHPGPASHEWRDRYAIPPEVPVVFNGRGFGAYVRNDTFFKAIPLVLNQVPDVVFLSVRMANNPVAKQWVQELGIEQAVRLLPDVTRADMAELFRLADVAVSPTEHDGTPNTLLEAMASGSFPIAGDIESIREWIADGVNGLLCDPANPESLAQAVLRAIKDVQLRERAARENQRLIAEKAEYNMVMQRAETFYREVIEAL